MDPHRRSSSITFSPGGIRHFSRESEGLMHHYDVEHNAFGLSDLVEDPEEARLANGSSKPRRRSGEVQTFNEHMNRKGTDR